MQGQQSGLTLLKYLMQAKSAAISDPPVSDAFLQGGYADLTSSIQAICLDSGQSSASPSLARVATTAMAKNFIRIIFMRLTTLYKNKYDKKSILITPNKLQTPTNIINAYKILRLK